jgi:hypothetical protein
MYLHDETFFDAASLAYLMEQCQSLKTLTLKKIALDEDTIRVLGDYSKPDLEIKLDRCQITGTAAVALAQVLRSNQGPTKLDYCYIDNFALADGLRGNSRLKSFKLRLSIRPDDGNQELLAIASTLKENKGLVHLEVVRYNCRLNDKTWDAICDSLKTHPTLQVLSLSSIQTFGAALLPPAVVKSQIQVLVGMLKMNKSIHTIHRHPRYSKHALFRSTITPYLETNKVRSRVRAIQKTRRIAYRAKVLGRALLAARTDVNRFWMLLSGNADVAIPWTTTTTTTTTTVRTTTTTVRTTTTTVRTTTTTTPAASLPTPATAVATANAAAVAVTIAATRAAPTTAASAATNGVTPTACRCTLL